MPGINSRCVFGNGRERRYSDTVVDRQVQSGDERAQQHDNNLYEYLPDSQSSSLRRRTPHTSSYRNYEAINTAFTNPSWRPSRTPRGGRRAFSEPVDAGRLREASRIRLTPHTDEFNLREQLIHTNNALERRRIREQNIYNIAFISNPPSLSDSSQGEEGAVGGCEEGGNRNILIDNVRTVDENRRQYTGVGLEVLEPSGRRPLRGEEEFV